MRVAAGPALTRRDSTELAYHLPCLSLLSFQVLTRDSLAAETCFRFPVPNLLLQKASTALARCFPASANQPSLPLLLWPSYFRFGPTLMPGKHSASVLLGSLSRTTLNERTLVRSPLAPPSILSEVGRHVLPTSLQRGMEERLQIEHQAAAEWHPLQRQPLFRGGKLLRKRPTHTHSKPHPKHTPPQAASPHDVLPHPIMCNCFE